MRLVVTSMFYEILLSLCLLMLLANTCVRLHVETMKPEAFLLDLYLRESSMERV